ncbi:hypothetical protein NE237_016464 [Protea cynaroides]|uniref:Uncharacterized protein n=1 Tax=Protea cynaroides TaxID=273540 RepID=A0A9Q0HH45_9MAGN|nr:hypothetical protein NE237_016464 [Protea cynaroides]
MAVPQCRGIYHQLLKIVKTQAPTHASKSPPSLNQTNAASSLLLLQKDRINHCLILILDSVWKSTACLNFPAMVRTPNRICSLFALRRKRAIFWVRFRWNLIWEDRSF